MRKLFLTSIEQPEDFIIEEKVLTQEMVGQMGHQIIYNP